MNTPTTLEQARKYRYNEWAGNPRGWAFVEGRCAYEVWGDHLSYQCQNKSGKGPAGLYCGTHAKKVKKENS